ncbi:hypothetical protein HM1_2760 [Heliomicrobium modesticaldum Ice1]|uniref:Uncharacterized protein n=1 Tax=Heliobacterium modesticaldum (strain ATCC 51547 / Ice1) TaxID=498761 RepID=B0TC16_HELMI|nr:PD40 domain-containing protein [Heliomicrobium modesticaldum]ABZ85289.1 hypothetical protein HM1_2760 [Heliomicrobium modesticaldum Ice1]
MKRLKPGIPLIAALLVVTLAAYNLASNKRFPLTTADSIVPGPDTQWVEAKILPPLDGLPAGYRFVDLREICEQALASYTVRTPGLGDVKPTPEKKSSESAAKDEVQWSSITFSNKKERMAFTTRNGLYVVNMKSRQAIRLHRLSPEDGTEFFPAIAWSPDDSMVTFGTVTRPKGDGSATYTISLARVNDGDVKNIHQSDKRPNLPVWSPDDKYIALDNPLFIYEVKSQNRTPVGMGADLRSPRWSPDSSYLIFSQYTSPERCEIYRYSPETREMLQMTDLGKTVAPVAWLKYPSTIIMETEVTANGSDTGRHHVGEVRPHSESSIRWLTSFDSAESNRFLCASPNERLIIMRQFQPAVGAATAEKGRDRFDLIAANREISSFFGWRRVKIHSLPVDTRLTYAWNRDGKLFYMIDSRSEGAAAGESANYELYLFDFDQMTRQKVWDATTPMRLVAVDGYNTVYYCPY